MDLDGRGRLFEGRLFGPLRRNRSRYLLLFVGLRVAVSQVTALRSRPPEKLTAATTWSLASRTGVAVRIRRERSRKATRMRAAPQGPMRLRMGAATPAPSRPPASAR
jgi:hypothetical protein